MRIAERIRTAITKVLDDEAGKSLQMAQEGEAKLVKELEGRGMTVITEADGLDIAAFREKVGAQIARDFPNFTPLIKQIQAVK